MTVLPLAYLPSAEYFAHLLRGGCVVDLGEHFVKRSERNRARILATDGVMELTVHVRNANRPRQSLRTRDRPISISTPNISSLSTAGSTDFWPITTADCSNCSVR